MPETEKQLLDDPFLMLGYGVNSYFDIIWSMFIMFSCVTLVSLPIYYCYGFSGSNAMDTYTADADIFQ
jgi:hypothetical protein